MLNCQMSDAMVTAQAAAVVALLNEGFMILYDGEQPKSADESPVAQRKLVSLRFQSPAAPTPDGGVIKFFPLSTGVVEAPGIAAWYRCFAQDGITAIMDGSVGVRVTGQGGKESRFNLELNNTNFLLSARVTIEDFRHVVAAASEERS